jgi:hypothetical protein
VLQAPNTHDDIETPSQEWKPLCIRGHKAEVLGAVPPPEIDANYLVTIVESLKREAAAATDV